MIEFDILLLLIKFGQYNIIMGNEILGGPGPPEKILGGHGPPFLLP